MPPKVRRGGRVAAIVGVAVLLTLTSSCGGGPGGAGPDGAGQGLTLVSFQQSGLDNVSLNTILEFRFSEAVNPSSVTPASFQIREGTAFGITVPGVFRVVGSTVFFEPRLPAKCDLTDSGFKPDTQYRVTIVGYPEQFRVTNSVGQPLPQTITHEFRTRVDTDPLLYLDQIASVGPNVIATSPTNGSAAVEVVQGNQVVIDLSENVKPCTVNSSTVLFSEYQRGDVNRYDTAVTPRPSGFVPGTDADPSPFSWGPLDAGEFNVSPPQTIRASLQLAQSFTGTQIVITPEFGEFPENTLIVVQLTFGIQDFGGLSLTPFIFAFTTENRVTQNGTRVLEFDGDPPVLDLSTAEVNTIRAPGLAQGFLLFAGDGDNGANLLGPTLPNTSASGCLVPFQVNNGVKDDFDPANDLAGVLDTGITVNTCTNSTDGSRAVVWEFQSFRVRSNVVVRVKGVNPAIILVSGDITIETGGKVLVRGDNTATAPQGQGANATKTNGTSTVTSTGGTGVAGGGNGGDSQASATIEYSLNGRQGFFMQGGVVSPTVGTATGPGCGHGNTSCFWSTQQVNNRNTPSGGGGGHAEVGLPGVANDQGTSPTLLDLPLDGAGGGTYGDINSRMLKPEAGSGGGGGSKLRAFSGTAGQGAGGGGGAGGGFLDLTCSGEVGIYGTLDAAGSRGGNGWSGVYYAWEPGTGGGGGGSGGGLRILTPNNITLGPGAIVTAAGGGGGTGGVSQAVPATPNNGGVGGRGRIVFEDGDSVITGLGGATVTPGEGAAGFYRGQFDATRFQGGGLTPNAITEILFAGPANPNYQVPVQSYGVQEDFIVGIPAIASRGFDQTSILIEIRGYVMLSDGTPDVSSATGWYTVGYFVDSLLPASPTWKLGQPPDVALPAGNVGAGIANINPAGNEFFDLRITFYLPTGIGPLDPGPFLDRWTLRFTYNQ
jgi:hypothetical protein